MPYLLLKGPALIHASVWFRGVRRVLFENTGVEVRMDASRQIYSSETNASYRRRRAITARKFGTSKSEMTYTAFTTSKTTTDITT